MRALTAICSLALLASCQTSPRRDQPPSVAQPTVPPPGTPAPPLSQDPADPSTLAGGSIASLPRSVQPTGQALFQPSSTYGVIAGVLSWADPSLASFSAALRKDAELYRLFRARGVPASQLSLLLDEQATTRGILDALARAVAATPKGGTLLFYYAGHGLKGKSGEGIFASYDIQTAQAESTGLSMANLTQALSTFQGGRVLLLADCCYSGALAQVARALRARGIEAASVTSAEAANVSTGNWTYTQALIDGFSGDALCDEDADGETSVAELVSEVRASMLYREGQRSGADVDPRVSRLAIAKVAGAQPTGLAKGSAARRRFVQIGRQGKQAVARVRADESGQLVLRLFDYATITDLRLPPAEVTNIRFERYPVGAALKVFWGGKIWDAKVTKADDEFLFITYPGWPAYWDEWITSRRVASAGAAAGQLGSLEAGALVQIEWHGGWYPGKVLRKEGPRHLVTYDGYGKEWDEWVELSRLRAR